jgi:hypothetical protein
MRTCHRFGNHLSELENILWDSIVILDPVLRTFDVHDNPKVTPPNKVVRLVRGEDRTERNLLSITGRKNASKELSNEGIHLYKLTTNRRGRRSDHIRSDNETRIKAINVLVGSTIENSVKSSGADSKRSCTL